MNIRRTARDRGFTLVEILVVIVLLGLLAALAVFSVRGITDRGTSTACAAERNHLLTAQEAYHIHNDRFGSAAELASGGLMSEATTLFAVTVDGDGQGYVLTGAGRCTGVNSTQRI